MKIAYLSFEAPTDNSGIACKIAAQVEQWRWHGHEVGHFLLREPGSADAEVKFCCQRRVSVPTLNAALCAASLRANLESFAPDIIYLREMLWFPGLSKALKVAPYILEINSDPLVEYRKQGNWKSAYFSLTGGLLMKRAAGYICVATELVKRVPSGWREKALVLGNGYDFEKVVQGEAPTNSRLQFVFVGSRDLPWHGTDELEKLAKVLPEAIFHVVVPGFKSKVENVRAYNGLYGEDLGNLYARVDVGIGSMALYRKNMSEASPLKTREYLAHGLPVVLPYLDTDLRLMAPEDGVLFLPNHPGAAVENCGPIEAFALRWKGRRINIEKMAGCLSTVTKERKRLEYFERVLNHAR